MNRFHFVGIAGSAMASVAAALSEAGERVTGSDSGVYPPMSDVLNRAGIAFHENYDRGHVLEVLREPGDALFVIGNAVSRGNPEVEEILSRKAQYTSLPAFVGERLIGRSTSVVISGTHGKTTTASLTAWVLEQAGKSPGYLVGGVPGNFSTGCRLSSGGLFVTEGDEYDTAFFDKRSKFVHYRPDITVINNIEFDHADIFDSLADIRKSFRQLVKLIPENGLLIVNGDDPHARDVAKDARARVLTVGFGLGNHWRADSIISAQETRFHVSGIEGRGNDFRIPLAGEYNVRNALAAIAVCDALGLSFDDIQAGFSSFRGVRRRMEIVSEAAGVTLMDDFAHHPTAIAATLSAVRDAFPGRRIWALFEPRSNTTTRNMFQQELADALRIASSVVIGAVNRPERYEPEERLSVEKLCADLNAYGVDARTIPDVDEMTTVVLGEIRNGDVLVLLSNGSFGDAREKLKRRLLERAGE